MQSVVTYKPDFEGSRLVVGVQNLHFMTKKCSIGNGLEGKVVNKVSMKSPFFPPAFTLLHFSISTRGGLHQPRVLPESSGKGGEYGVRSKIYVGRAQAGRAVRALRTQSPIDMVCQFTKNKYCQKRIWRAGLGKHSPA